MLAAVTWRQLCALAAKLPEVTVDTWYRTPALKVRGKGFVRLWEDGHTCVFVVTSLDEKDALLATKPKLYFTTDHYNGHASVLVDLRALGAKDARERLASGWSAAAPATLLRARRQK